MPDAKKTTGLEADKPLSYYVHASLNRYFKELNGCEPNELYRLILSEVEKPLLENVMQHCDGNNSRAAEILGINRATLRKKIQQYQINQN